MLRMAFLIFYSYSKQSYLMLQCHSTTSHYFSSTHYVNDVLVMYVNDLRDESFDQKCILSLDIHLGFSILYKIRMLLLWTIISCNLDELRTYSLIIRTDCSPISVSQKRCKSLNYLQKIII